MVICFGLSCWPAFTALRGELRIPTMRGKALMKNNERSSRNDKSNIQSKEDLSECLADTNVLTILQILVNVRL